MKHKTQIVPSIDLLLVLVVAALALAVGYARANPGDLDPTWGEEGVTITVVTEGNEWANSHVLLDDGRYVVVGWFNDPPGSFGVVRYMPDGQLDPSFGNGGHVMTDFTDDPELVDAAWAVAARPDGGLYVIGDTCDADYDVCELAIAAYMPDGSLDAGFGEGGLATVASELGPTYAWPGRAIVQPDGKLVAGGVVYMEDVDSDLLFARFRPDGTPDETFGDGGVTITDLGERGSSLQDMMALPDDQILAVGVFGNPIDPLSGELDAGFIARFNEDGSLDTGFGGGNGYVAWDNGKDEALAQHALMTPDGQLLILGFQTGTNGFDCTLQRFDIDGNQDLTFGDSGLVVISSGQSDQCSEIVPAPGGKVIFGGPAFPLEEDEQATTAIAGSMRRQKGMPVSASSARQAGEPFENWIARYYLDGTPDPTFGDNGLLPFSLAGGSFWNITVQPDGRTLIAGEYMIGEDTIDIITARFDGDDPVQSNHPEAVDPTWGWKGAAFTDFNGLDNNSTTQVLMPDGKLVVVAWVNIYPGDFGLVRYLPDGSLDPSFGDGGRVVTAFSDDPEHVDAPWSVNARPNGGLHVFGETCDADYEFCDFAIAAYLADGSLDESFGDGGLVITPVDDALTVFSWPTRSILQADGKIVAGGIALNELGQDLTVDLVLIRYNPDGSLDDDFGDGGIGIYDFDGQSHFPQDIVALPGDQIMIVGGVTEVFEGFSYMSEVGFLARINSDGSVDTGFGDDGILTWDYDGQPAGFDRALVTPANEIFLIGAGDSSLGGVCYLQRLDLDGTVDATFGDDGLVAMYTGHWVGCYDGTLMADGRIAFAGWVSPAEDETRAAAASGQPGKGVSGRGAALAGGSRGADQGEIYDNLAGVFHPDGTPDTTFGPDGLVQFTLTPGVSAMYNLSAQRDGRLLTVGDVLMGEQVDHAVVRLFGGQQTSQIFMPVVRR